MKINKKRLFFHFKIILGLLLIPLVAMLFTAEVNWSAFDFIVAAVLLSSTAILLELVWSGIKLRRKRFVLAAAIVFMLILTWAELAVGIFGSPFAGN